MVLKTGSLTELTNQVAPSTGFLSHQFPQASNGSSYRVFAFYQRLTLNRNIPPAKNITATIFGNGSFTVDHFDPRGAKVLTDFWEQHILTNGVRELLSQVGHVGEFIQFLCFDQKLAYEDM